MKMRKKTQFAKQVLAGLGLLGLACVSGLTGALSLLAAAQDKPLNKLVAVAVPALAPIPASAFVPPPEATQQSLVQRGEYLARAGDCIACHTSPKGATFAGGLPLKTSFGTIISTNITPDKEQGIGKYTQADFNRALREGKTPEGDYLYPAMPYANYSKLNDADLSAMYAYFMQGVTAKKQDNPQTHLIWPFSINRLVALWNWVYLPTKPFENTPTQSAEWNRGAYLVQGLGHCGACHTPRSLLGGEKAFSEKGGAQFLSGASIDGWYAQPLRNSTLPGLGTWRITDIVQYLKTGRTQHTAAFGAMAEVVSKSTQYLTREDLLAIGTYLMSNGDQPGAVTLAADHTSDPVTAALRAGETPKPGALVLLNNCAGCHRSSGQGAATVFPALASSSVIAATDPTSLIRIVLEGASMPHTTDAPSQLAMPGLGWRLTDNNIADVLTFIRTSWGNPATSISAEQVAKIRKSLSQAAPASAPVVTAQTAKN